MPKPKKTEGHTEEDSLRLKLADLRLAYGEAGRARMNTTRSSLPVIFQHPTVVDVEVLLSMVQSHVQWEIWRLEEKLEKEVKNA